MDDINIELNFNNVYVRYIYNESFYKDVRVERVEFERVEYLPQNYWDFYVYLIDGTKEKLITTSDKLKGIEMIQKKIDKQKGNDKIILDINYL